MLQLNFKVITQLGEYLTSFTCGESLTGKYFYPKDSGSNQACRKVRLKIYNIGLFLL